LQLKEGTTSLSLQYGTAPRRRFQRMTGLAGDMGLRFRGVWDRGDALPGETGRQGEGGLLAQTCPLE